MGANPFEGKDTVYDVPDPEPDVVPLVEEEDGDEWYCTTCPGAEISEDLVCTRCGASEDVRRKTKEG